MEPGREGKQRMPNSVGPSVGNDIYQMQNG
jgi:hypothetical protein